MNTLERKQNQLVDLIYHASSSPDEWQPTMQHIANELGACNALIYCSDANKGRVVEYEQSATGYKKLPEYKEYYHTQDPWGMLWNKVPLDRAYPNFEVVDIKQFKHSEIYNDWWRIQEFLYTCGGVFLRDENYFGIACFQLAKPHSKYSKKSIKLLEFLMPHFRRAMQLQHRVTNCIDKNISLKQCIDQLPYGLVLLRADERLSILNNTAENIFESNSPIYAHKNKIKCKQKFQDDIFQEIVQEVLANPACTDKEMIISNNGSGYLQLYFYPFRTTSTPHNETLSPVRIAIFIIDSNRIPLPDPTQICKTLGISPTESLLAKGLIEGKSIEKIAEDRHVSKNTIQSQTKSIFRKIGINSKNDLIRKLHDIHRIR